MLRKSHEGWKLRAAGEHAAALDAFSCAPAISLFDNPVDGVHPYSIGARGHGIGACLIALGRKTEAEEHLRGALEEYLLVLKKNRGDDDILFYLACTQALLLDKKGTLETIKRYMRTRGVRYLQDPMKYFRDDPDFGSLTNDPDFQRLVMPESEIERKVREDKEKAHEVSRALALQYTRRKSIDAELLGHLYSKFELRADRIEQAHHKLIEAARSRDHAFDDMDDTFFNILLASHSLTECFENNELSFDEDGNLVGFNLDSDMWVFYMPLISLLAEFVTSGSLFLLLDPGSCYWKVDFLDGKIRYWKSKST